MRTELEMFNLILNIAKNDERIYAVFMNGSRTNDIAKDVSFSMNVKYNEIEAINSLKFLKDVHILPKDAQEIY